MSFLASERPARRETRPRRRGALRGKFRRNYPNAPRSAIAGALTRPPPFGPHLAHELHLALCFAMPLPRIQRQCPAGLEPPRTTRLARPSWGPLGPEGGSCPPSHPITTGRSPGPATRADAAAAPAAPVICRSGGPAGPRPRRAPRRREVRGRGWWGEVEGDTRSGGHRRPAQAGRVAIDEEVIHSPSLDHRRDSFRALTAIASALRWPTTTTRRLPRVTPV
jgi:hypothetical protein